MEDAVGGDADGVLDAKELAELVEQGQSKTGIAAQLDLHPGESGLQTRHQAQQHGHDAGMTGGVSRAQARRQQTSGVALEDQHGVIHVLAVGAVEEAELLLAVVGSSVESRSSRISPRWRTWSPQRRMNCSHRASFRLHQIAGGRRVLPAAEGGLRAERVAEFLIGDDLQHGIVAQAVGVVGVFVSGDDLIDALPQQCQRVVVDALV